jgi:hypothetical protein
VSSAKAIAAFRHKASAADEIEALNANAGGVDDGRRWMQHHVGDVL